MIIQNQEKTSNSATRVRDAIAEKRFAFEELMEHLHSIHEKQTANLIASQERNYQSEKVLMGMETRAMKVNKILKLGRTKIRLCKKLSIKTKS
jgi:hypothetical protein